MWQKMERIGGNRVVIALSSARLGDAIGNSILFVLIPLYVAALPAPAFPWPETVRVGVLISVFGLVNAVLEPVFGAFIDRAGRTKPFILAGLVMMAIATLGFLFAVRYTDLLFLRTLQGIGVGVTVPAALALMVTASTKSTRGGAMGIYTTSRMLGLGIGPLIGGLLYDAYGFAPAFTVGGAFIILALLLVNMWVKEPPRRAPVPKSVRIKIIDRKLLSGGIVGAAFATLIMAVDFSMISSLETQFNAKLGMNAFIFGLAFSAVVFSRVFVQVPLGRLSDHWGRKPFIIGGMLLLVPSTALIGYATTTTYLMVLRLIQGIASAAVAAPAFAVAGDLAQAGGEGRQMSILTMGFGLGVAVGPLLSGFLAIYSFTLPFVLAGLLSLVAAWATLRFVPETVTREEVAREAPAFGGK